MRPAASRRSLLSVTMPYSFMVRPVEGSPIASLVELVGVDGSTVTRGSLADAFETAGRLLAGTGGEIRVLAYRYRLDRAVDFPANSRVILEKGTTIYLERGSPRLMQGTVLEGGRLVAAGPVRSLLVVGAVEAEVRGTVLDGAGRGVVGIAASQSRLLVEGAVFANNTIALQADTVAGLTVRDSVFEGNTSCVLVAGDSKGIRVEDNRFEDCTGSGSFGAVAVAPSRWAVDVRIRGNTMVYRSGPYYAGVLLSRVSEALVEANRFVQEAASQSLSVSVNIDQSESVVLRDNTVEAPHPEDGGMKIYIRDSKSVIVEGNRLGPMGGNSHGAMVEVYSSVDYTGSRHIVFRDNVFLPNNRGDDGNESHGIVFTGRQPGRVLIEGNIFHHTKPAYAIPSLKKLVVVGHNEGYPGISSDRTFVVGDGSSTELVTRWEHSLPVDTGIVVLVTPERPAKGATYSLVDLDGDGFKETVEIHVYFDTPPAQGEQVWLSVLAAIRSFYGKLVSPPPGPGPF